MPLCAQRRANGRPARLSELVLVVRKAEVETAAVDLELGSQMLLRHRRALDVPAGPPGPPRGIPPGVLERLRRLPEGEVARVFLQVARLLGHHVVEVRAGEPAVVGELGHPEVDVAAGLVREAAPDQLLDQRDDFGDRLGRERLEVRPAQAEAVRVLEVPPRRPPRELVARDPVLAGGVVDLVVYVGDVLDERHLVPPGLEPALEPKGQHVRPRVPDVDPLVDGGAAEVHADGPGRWGELLLRARVRVIEPHRCDGALPRGGARERPSRAPARARRR
jgi:hypothetical protein